MGLKSNEIDTLLIRQLKQTANKPVTRLVLLTGFNTPPTPSQEGKQLQPVIINRQLNSSKIELSLSTQEVFTEYTIILSLRHINNYIAII